MQKADDAGARLSRRPLRTGDALLERLGIAFSVADPSVEEARRTGEAPEDMARGSPRPRRARSLHAFRAA